MNKTLKLTCLSWFLTSLGQFVCAILFRAQQKKNSWKSQEKTTLETVLILLNRETLSNNKKKHGNWNKKFALCMMWHYAMSHSKNITYDSVWYDRLTQSQLPKFTLVYGMSPFIWLGIVMAFYKQKHFLLKPRQLYHSHSQYP